MPARRIKPHAKYLQALEQLAASHPRAPEVFKGAAWSLARNPHEGIFQKDIDVWRVTVLGQPGVDVPPHALFYAFDDSEIRLLAIKSIEIAD